MTSASLFPLIDLRAFSSVWYWVLMLVLWGQATDRVLGVPWVMIADARRAGTPEAAAAVADQLRPALWRLSAATRRSLLAQAAIAGFALSLLAVLGFVYGLELAQALFGLVAPLGLVTLIGYRLARRILDTGLSGDALLSAMAGAHGTTTGIAILAIGASAIWGASRVLTLPTFGG
jgi:hypothetical protein